MSKSIYHSEPGPGVRNVETFLEGEWKERLRLVNANPVNSGRESIGLPRALTPLKRVDAE